MPSVQDLLTRKMSSEVIGVASDTPASEAAAIMAEKRIGILICRDENGAMTGVLSERDMVRAIAERPGDMADLKAEDLFTRDVQTCTPMDDLKDVVKTMGRGGFRHMPVMKGDELAGMVSVTDIFRYYVDHAPQDRMDVFAAYCSMSLP